MVNLKLVSGEALLEFSTEAKLHEAQPLLMAITELWFESLAPDDPALTSLTIRLQKTSAALHAAVSGATHAQPDP